MFCNYNIFNSICNYNIFNIIYNSNVFDIICRKRFAVDKYNEPLNSERVPYVIVFGAPGTPLYQLVREPQELLANSQLKLNTIYYVTRVILPPLHRFVNVPY